jgi:hypothetical protein
VYSKLHYNSKIREIVNTRWREHYLKENPGHDQTDMVPAPTIKFRNAVTQELFDAEPENVKEEVEREREKMGNEESTMVAELDAADDLDQKERERIDRAKKYQVYVVP